MTAGRHTSTEFVAFLADIVVSLPKQREIRIIVHKILGRRRGGDRVFQATPERAQARYSDVLFVAQSVRHVVVQASAGSHGRGIVTPKADAKRRIRRYMCHYNAHARPLK